MYDLSNKGIWLRAKYLIGFCLLGISLWVIFFVFIILGSYFVVGIPTGVSYNLTIKDNHVFEFETELKALIKQKNLKAVNNEVGFQSYENSTTSIDIYTANESDSSKDITIFILAKVESRNEWQGFAGELEKLLTNLTSTMKVSFQLNPEVFACKKQCDYQTSFPANFDFVNNYPKKFH